MAKLYSLFHNTSQILRGRSPGFGIRLIIDTNMQMTSMTGLLVCKRAESYTSMLQAEHLFILEFVPIKSFISPLPYPITRVII